MAWMKVSEMQPKGRTDIAIVAGIFATVNDPKD
jgi:tyrosyl-tRNA synthetase